MYANKDDECEAHSKELQLLWQVLPLLFCQPLPVSRRCVCVCVCVCVCGYDTIYYSPTAVRLGHVCGYALKRLTFSMLPRGTERHQQQCSCACLYVQTLSFYVLFD